ncbi:MAG: hypothetical protein HC854_10800 [Flavobacterium sp.]|nr:hypothetical protein [Flavobacterium sp.]
MKTILLFLTIFLTQCASKNKDTNSSEVIVENTIEQEEYQIKLLKVIADSRCPEGVNCVWEGQVEMSVGVYKGNELLEEKQLVVNSRTVEENATWASQYSKKTITFIGVLPARVKDTPIYESDYKLLIKYD